MAAAARSVGARGGITVYRVSVLVFVASCWFCSGIVRVCLGGASLVVLVVSFAYLWIVQRRRSDYGRTLDKEADTVLSWLMGIGIGALYVGLLLLLIVLFLSDVCSIHVDQQCVRQCLLPCIVPIMLCLLAPRLEIAILVRVAKVKRLASNSSARRCILPGSDVVSSSFDPRYELAGDLAELVHERKYQARTMLFIADLLRGRIHLLWWCIKAALRPPMSKMYSSPRTPEYSDGDFRHDMSLAREAFSRYGVSGIRQELTRMLAHHRLRCRIHAAWALPLTEDERNYIEAAENQEQAREYVMDRRSFIIRGGRFYRLGDYMTERARHTYYDPIRHVWRGPGNL
jgi:hypothetical protein